MSHPADPSSRPFSRQPAVPALRGWDATCAAARHLLDQALATGRRQMLGVAACPGAGKSTLAARLLDELGDAVAIVPMDGFHLANSELARLGLAQRKGSPPSFDAPGFVALLERLRRDGGPVYAPEFRRELEESIAGALLVAPQHRLLIVEGNYLLLEEGGWAGVRPLLDACWYLAVDDGLRRERLLSRHMHHGRTRQQALDWMAGNDELNAALIAAQAHRADAWVHLDTDQDAA
ncbi:nucleoside/nucleotide kinase family protein [Amphibiibacter pelophylacis]|uniref:Nucleoside/nucleotide kinase family protein n=1 Tax=Amphibiibacter pelophylacis TaxID=1799477 RepID=A0ACC6P438_9BURK